ncbi:transglutaminase family protein [Longirhabdus pacifica]|uniref:transglutaminase family protein n=1 Tax=Longirhabdus pacifica TaxID=2305227 RepID=UPI001008FAD1|nr:transglutaminase domain-containing protein [Longirhabdus pacifica]
MMNWKPTHTQSPWMNPMKAIFWIIIIMQYMILISNIDFADGFYWLEQSTWMLYFVIGVFLLLELCLPTFVKLKRIIQLLSTLIVVFFVSKKTSFLSTDELEPIFFQFNDEGNLLWFMYSIICVSFLLIIWMFIHVISTKLRVLLFTMFSVVLFGIFDSFTTIFLWDQVVWILFASLMLMISHHVEYLQRYQPYTWSKIKIAPKAILVQISVLFSIFFIIAWFAPFVSPILTDPYTAWMESKGVDVVTSGKQVRFDEPSSVVQSSGYGRDDSMLGGAFEYDNSIVMTVEAPFKSYWRGETKSLYTGSGWLEHRIDDRTEVYIGGSLQDWEFDMYNTDNRITEELKQVITMEEDKSYPVLFGAFDMDGVQTLNNEPSLSGTSLDYAYYGQYFKWNEKQDYPSSYEITSQVPVIDEAALYEVGLISSTGRFSEIWSDYLDLGTVVPQEVIDLTLEITADEPSLYGKMKSLENYLKTTYPYTNTPDVSKGSSDDFVYNFLFDIREGYCDYYSTSLAVMGRVIGVPTRWVKGYTAGQLQTDNNFRFGVESEELGEGGTYVVRNRNAHSWVEAYFEGYGWIPFEPTANFSLPEIVVEEEVEQEEEEEQNVEKEEEEKVEEKQEEKEEEEESTVVSYIKLGMFIISCMIVLTALFYTLKSRGFQWSHYRFTSRTINEQIITSCWQFVRWSDKKGTMYREGETIREHFSRIQTNYEQIHEQITYIRDVFEQAKYGNVVFSSEDLKEVKLKIKIMKSEIKKQK